MPLNVPRESALQSMLADRAYGEALNCVQAWIVEDPLSSRAFKWLAEVRSALGEPSAAEFARRRVQQLLQIESNTKASALGERYRALSASTRGKARLNLAGYDFPYVRMEPDGAGVTLTGVSLCGVVSVRIYVEGPVERFQNECAILQRLTEGNCQTAASLVDCGELSPADCVILGPLAQAAGLMLNPAAPVWYHVCNYVRADRGRFGAADLLLALLEQQALGVYQNNVTLRNLRYDSVSSLCRLSDYAQAGYLDAGVRAMPPKAYLQWCLERESQREASGGEASYLKGALQGADWIWKEGRLNLMAAQIFTKPRIRDLPEPSIQTFITDKLHYQGSRDWEVQREALVELELAADASILDLGCGLGAAARHFSNATREVVGLEVERSFLTGGALLANIGGYAADFREVDLDYESIEGCWDVVLALGVLHHYSKRMAAFERIGRLCRRQLIVECGLEERGYKWFGRWYQRGEALSFKDLDALRTALLEWFPGFECKVPARATDSDRWLFVLERKGAAL